jgi:two-component system sensor histidine kinase ArlS
MKLPLKINLLFTAIVSGILLLMAFIIYNVSRQNLHADFRQRLLVRSMRTASMFNLLGNDTLNVMKAVDASISPVLSNRNINIYNKHNEKLYEYHDETTSALIPDTSWFSEARTEGHVYRTYGTKDVCVYADIKEGTSNIIVVAAENLGAKEYLNSMQRIFLIFLPGAILFTMAAGYIFSRSIIKPVKETIHDVQLITSQNLSHRLFVGNRRDELAQLNATFNDLLDRLEESFAIQRRFISNASHELSTPLTSVSSQIEVALMQDRNDEEYRRVLRSVLEDIRELHQLSKTLLEIAKAGTHGTISLDKVRIDEVVIRAHTEVMKQNPGFNVALEFADFPDAEEECFVFGNSSLLQSAFKNIMENGCKYSPDQSVLVQLSFTDGRAEVLFINKGDIIPEDEISRMLEPFYRGANAEGKQGVGLGLTLTRRIISLHKGTLSIQSEAERGTVVIILLPTLNA